MRIVKYILRIAGALLLLDGVAVAAMSNLNLGVVLVIALGLAVLLCGIFFEKIGRVTKKGVLRWVKYLVIFGLGCFLALSAFLACFGGRDTVTYSEDVVIVLGAGVHGDAPSRHLARRLDKAAEYYGKNSSALIAVTGGKGFQESVTEAYAMKKYLIEKGVPADSIVMEEQAASTYENFRYSKEILDGIFSRPYTTAVITNDFHIYRACRIAEALGFGGVTHLHGNIEWYSVPQNYVRESLAVLKMWILG
ncbi:MAG: YdcF family protein [Clostridia bacterium]